MTNSNKSDLCRAADLAEQLINGMNPAVPASASVAKTSVMMEIFCLVTPYLTGAVQVSSEDYLNASKLYQKAEWAKHVS